MLGNRECLGDAGEEQSPQGTPDMAGTHGCHSHGVSLPYLALAVSYVGRPRRHVLLSD